jgi:hypothetical protein
VVTGQSNINEVHWDQIGVQNKCKENLRLPFFLHSAVPKKEHATPIDRLGRHIFLVMLILGIKQAYSIKSLG